MPNASLFAIFPQSGGNALLFLDPAEEAMVEVLRAARIPLKKTAVRLPRAPVRRNEAGLTRVCRSPR